jgi:hypothetical protein
MTEREIIEAKLREFHPPGDDTCPLVCMTLDEVNDEIGLFADKLLAALREARKDDIATTRRGLHILNQGDEVAVEESIRSYSAALAALSRLAGDE